MEVDYADAVVDDACLQMLCRDRKGLATTASNNTKCWIQREFIRSHS